MEMFNDCKRQNPPIESLAQIYQQLRTPTTVLHAFFACRFVLNSCGRSNYDSWELANKIFHRLFQSIVQGNIR